MSSPTPNMGLVGWNLGLDAYDHNQLYGNFVLLDAHDHTNGKGLKIGTAALVDGSVTTVKLADASVTGVKLLDGSVSYSKLAADAVAWTLGDVKFQWFPPSGAAIIPTGWRVADGSVLGPGQHDWNSGGGSIILPNLIDAMPYGVDITRVGNTGGSNNLSLAHSHSVNAHSHTVASHTHSVNAHAHTVGTHIHGIASDGNHSHNIANGKIIASRQTTAQSQTPTGSDNFLQSLYIPGFNTGQGSNNASIDVAGLHNHGGATDGGTAFSTSSDATSTGGASPSTSSDGASTASALGSVDNRSAWVGLLPLIRVRK